MHTNDYKATQKMSTIKQPVVWCSDPNSTNQKPTAFTLHGIQFEGNATEQHMVALREIINAAAEGRLLLPSNGAIVLLECDNAEQCEQAPQKQIEALPVETDAAGSCAKSVATFPNFEPKYSEFASPELGKYDFIYEFLCCAKCINRMDRDPHRSHRTVCTEEIHRRNGKRYAYEDAVSRKQRRQKYHRCDASHAIETAECAALMPLYATVNNKKHRSNNPSPVELLPNDGGETAALIHDDSVRHENIDHNVAVTNEAQADQQAEHQSNGRAAIELEANDTIDLSIVQLRPGGSANASRKTSLDSSCTVGSMDSGFIEMQNKLEAKNVMGTNAIESGQANNAIVIDSIETASAMMTPADGIDKNEDDDDAHKIVTLATPSTTNNQYQDAIPLKECSTQSRNRRKSYEEFKAIYHSRATLECELPFVLEHESNSSTTCSQTQQIKARRKSYEEFKALVSESKIERNGTNETMTDCASNGTIITTTATTIETNANVIENTAAITTTTTITNTKSQKKKKEQNKRSSTKTPIEKCDALATTKTAPSFNSTNQAKTKNDIYKTNFKIYDKLISYGTIYDIMQKKSDIYRAYRKYDAYMTYGTIYEILQRKSDDHELFQRKRVASEKCISKRSSLNSTECIDDIGETLKDDRSKSITFGTIYELLQRKQRQKKSNSLPNGMCGTTAIETPSESVTKTSRSDRHNDGCIYDIIQTGKYDANQSTTSLPSSSSTSPTSSSSNIVKNRFLVERVNEKELPQMRSSDTDRLTAQSASCAVRSHTYDEPTPSFLSIWNGQKTKKKKSNRMRRFSHILSYTQQQRSSIGERIDEPISGSSLVPETINELTDKCDESASSAVTATVASGAASLPDANAQRTVDTYPSESKRLDKLRKLSTPFPMCSGTDESQPPKLSPRKLSAPPPILVSSTAKCKADRISSTKHRTKKSKSDLTSAHGAGNAKVDSKSAANEQCMPAESDSIKLKSVHNVRERSPANKSAAIAAMPTDGTVAKSSKRPTVPDGKTKSRRLSEFTRGEFLNEKL